MLTKGRAYFEPGGGKRLIDRAVRGGDEVRLTYYPTSSSTDEPITVMLRRLKDGAVGVHVRVDRSDHSVERIFEGVIDQPEREEDR